MKTGSFTLLVVATLCGMQAVHANIIFSQDFSESTVLSHYINASNPDSGQWNSMVSGAGTIANGSLGFTRSTFARGFTRSTDFAPAPEGLIYKFDLSVSGTTKTTAAAVWQIGSGFSTSTTGAEPAGRVHSQFGIGFGGGSDYFVRNPVTDTKGNILFGSKWPITWVINNSPDPIQYTAPDRKIYTVQSDQWDLWVGSYGQLLGQSATSPNVPLTDLKMAFTSGSGTIWMDNFSIEGIPAVPEPASTGLLAAAFMALFALAARLRQATGSDRTPSVVRRGSQRGGDAE